MRECALTAPAFLTFTFTFAKSQDALWKEATPESIMDSKLKCVFDFPAVNSSLNASGGRSMNNDDVSQATSIAPSEATLAGDASRPHGSPTGRKVP